MSGEMYERKWRYKETDLLIRSDNKRSIKISIKEALKTRLKLERFVARYPEFRYSLEPLEFEPDSQPEIARRMIAASKLLDVGPFAGVAGAISQMSAEAGAKAGAKNILVDNGGDMAIIGDSEFLVGIYAGESAISMGLCFHLKASDLPAGICTSSGTVGHSTSFGEADAVTVVADDATLADVAATAVGNVVKGDVNSSIKNGLMRSEGIQGVRGCLIAKKDQVGMSGGMPEIRAIKEAPISLGNKFL